jgi:hypothetical protein
MIRRSGYFAAFRSISYHEHSSDGERLIFANVFALYLTSDSESNDDELNVNLD